MGFIKIEWEIGKDRGDRILVWLIDNFFYYIRRYVSIYKKNYLKLRAKSKIPSLKKIDFRKRVYPFIFFFIIIPIVIATSFYKYIPEDVLLASSIIYVFILGFIFVIALIYFIYRIIIDLWVTGICSLRSFITTTIYSFKKSKKIIKKIFSPLRQTS